MWPDHGHELLDDLGKGTFLGYPAVGRLKLKGLAELRGVMLAVSQLRGLPCSQRVGRKLCRARALAASGQIMMRKVAGWQRLLRKRHPSMH